MVAKKTSHNVLRKFANVCWAPFKGCMWPEGRGLDKLGLNAQSFIEDRVYKD